MYERLSNKNEKPTMEEFLAYIGEGKELFDNVDAFLLNDINSVKMIKFDAHSRCWKISYHVKSKYICDIITEKDTFTIVTRLSDESIRNVYDGLLPYAKECIDNSPYRHKGWIEYRVLSAIHLDDIKTMLQIRANYKQ
ncbi:DUF3788 family protein [Lachnoclostridium phytofermentans]|uniref:DUF3788 family protein n=1 Tax=Lachnoclostridium phytofermentans TaxID=66219 RepID=UPI0004980666|nr:DUF3788 family protein [Lachnoclostridium phytofermentans]